MPRRPRQEIDGGTFHVYARGNDRNDVFLDATDRRKYLALLGRTARRKQWQVLSYCLMPNHVHLLVQTPGANLGAGMHLLHSPYAQGFNKRHGRVGHVFQGRYGATRVTTDAYFVTVVRYIALNPVSAGLVEAPVEWPWSSHRAVAGREDPPPWLAVGRLLAYLEGASAAATYAELTQLPKGA